LSFLGIGIKGNKECTMKNMALRSSLMPIRPALLACCIYVRPLALGCFVNILNIALISSYTIILRLDGDVLF